MLKSCAENWHLRLLLKTLRRFHACRDGGLSAGSVDRMSLLYRILKIRFVFEVNWQEIYYFFDSMSENVINFQV